MSNSILIGMFGMPGHLELIIVAAIILLLFGHRLPGVMRSLGRGVVEFKRGIHGVDDDDAGGEEDADKPAKKPSDEKAAVSNDE